MQNTIYILARLNRLMSECDIVQQKIDDARERFYDEPYFLLALELKQFQLDMKREMIEQTMLEISSLS